MAGFFVREVWPWWCLVGIWVFCVLSAFFVLFQTLHPSILLLAFLFLFVSYTFNIACLACFGDSLLASLVAPNTICR